MNVRRMDEMELTKSVRGPPGIVELSAKSRRLRAPAMSGSKDGRATLKSTRHAEVEYDKHLHASTQNSTTHHCG